MTGDWRDIVVTACVLAVFAVPFLCLALALGWAELTLVLKFVPPWKRKAPEPRRTAAAQPADTATATPLARKAS